MTYRVEHNLELLIVFPFQIVQATGQIGIRGQELAARRYLLAASGAPQKPPRPSRAPHARI